MFKCENCGKVVENLETYRESHGEEMPENCGCGGEFLIAKQCKKCGDWFLEVLDEIEYSHCKECADSLLNVENCLAYIKGKKLQKDFFVEWFFDSDFTNVSDELVECCEKAWENIYKDEFTKDRAKESLFSFVKDDISSYFEFMERGD